MEHRSDAGTVLLVDDEEVALNVAKTALARAGFTVLTACDGREGVNLFRSHSEDIDVVLLDLTMPQLDGRGAFVEFKRLRDDVPIILMSGHTEELVRIQMQGKAFDGFLQKPYHVASLIQKVRDFTEAPKNLPAPSQPPVPRPSLS